MLDKIVEFVLRMFSNYTYAAAAGSLGGPDKPPELTEIAVIIDNIFGYIFPAGVLLAVIMLIVGGYMWIVSGGDPARKQQAQGTLTWAVIGLVVLFLVKTLIDVLVNFVTG